MSDKDYRLDIGYVRALVLFSSRGLLIWAYVPLAVVVYPLARLSMDSKPSLRAWVGTVDAWVIFLLCRALWVRTPAPVGHDYDGLATLRDAW